MKGTFFQKPLEWNIQTDLESWTQGEVIKGHLTVKNHSAETISLNSAGVGLCWADIKKVHAKAEGVLKAEIHSILSQTTISPNAILEHPFELKLDENSLVTDKKGSYFLTYGQNMIEAHLQLKVEPRVLFGKIIGLLDTFYRFKLKDYKSVKKSVEYKLIPPTSRDMANLEGLLLSLSMNNDELVLKWDFQVKRLDTSGVTNKITKESVKLDQTLSPKDYSLGKGMINQDRLLKLIEEILGQVKIKNAF